MRRAGCDSGVAGDVGGRPLGPSFSLADHAPQYARCARRPLPRNGSFATLLPLPPSGGIARGATRSLSPPSLTLGPNGCGPVVAALTDRHQGHDGRGLGSCSTRGKLPPPSPEMARRLANALSAVAGVCVDDSSDPQWRDGFTWTSANPCRLMDICR